MDQNFAQPDDLSARRDAMRERLRLKAERVLEAVEVIGDPKSFLEVERAARAILVVDRMILQLFSPPRHKTLALVYDDGERYDYGARGRGSAVRVPVEKVGDAPIVASGDTSPLHSAVNSYAKGEDEINESDETEGAEKEAHANAIFAAYCEFKRLERFQKSAKRFSDQEARQNKEREAEERFGLGP